MHRSGNLLLPIQFCSEYIHRKNKSWMKQKIKKKITIFKKLRELWFFKSKYWQNDPINHFDTIKFLEQYIFVVLLKEKVDQILQIEMCRCNFAKPSNMINKSGWKHSLKSLKFAYNILEKIKQFTKFFQYSFYFYSWNFD